MTVPFALLLASALWLPSLANAQVLRCEDAQSRITYTDAATCPDAQHGREVLPALSAEAQAQQEALYQQALERKRQAQAQQRAHDHEAAQRQAAIAAAQPPTPPSIIVQVPESPPPAPIYVPAPQRPPMLHPAPPHRPPPLPGSRPPHGSPPATGYQCNVFRCYDGLGNVWPRPSP